MYAVDFPVNPVLFRLLRIGKLARAIRMAAPVPFRGVGSGGPALESLVVVGGGEVSSVERSPKGPVFP